MSADNKEKPANKENAVVLTEETENTVAAPEQLNEIQLSWAGKLFFAGLAAYLTGTALQKFGTHAPPKLPFKLRGTPQQINAVVSAIVASKAFQAEVSKPGATVESVIQKLNLKNLTKEKFKQLTGKPWPL